MDLSNALSELFWLKIFVTLLCGGLIGFERQWRGKPAGIRTSILICLGTEIFVSFGAMLDGPAADPARVVGQVITGVGFLGAGVIMGKEGIVKGVTSAAVIWILAAIGVVIGMGYLFTALALTLVTLGVLVGVEFLESTFKKLRKGVHGQYHRG
ncbi:MAG: MgtC/SapB family protein [Desulfurivibrionaceae bacterium]